MGHIVVNYFYRYEDLVENTERELRRLIKFLDLEVNEEALKCTLKEENKDGHFKRNKLKEKPPKFVFAFRKQIEKMAEKFYKNIGLNTS